MRKLIILCLVVAAIVGGYYALQGRFPWQSAESRGTKYSGVRVTEADELTQTVFYDHPRKPSTETTAQESKIEAKGRYVALEAFCYAVNPGFADTWKKEAERLDAKTLGEQLQDLSRRKIIKLITVPRLLVNDGDSSVWQLARQDTSPQSLLKITVTPKIQNDRNILMDVALENQQDNKKVSELTSQCRVKPGGFVIVGVFDFQGATNTLILKADVLE